MPSYITPVVPFAQRPVDDVRVAGDPADVGRAPVDVGVRLHVVDVVVRRDARRPGSRRSCARSPWASRSSRSCTSGTAGPPSPSARTGRLRRRPRPRATRRRGPRSSGPRRPSDAAPRTTGRRAPRRAPRRRSPSAARSSPRRHASSWVISTSHSMSFIRAESESAEKPPKTTVCGRADPRAGEHRDRQLRDHAHVDRHRRALADAQRPQRVRQPRGLAQEIRERDDPPIVLGLALPVVRDLVAPARLDVAVDAVEAGVQLPAEVPLRVGQLPLVELGERLEPGDALAPLPLPQLLERKS